MYTYSRWLIQYSRNVAMSTIHYLRVPIKVTWIGYVVGLFNRRGAIFIVLYCCVSQSYATSQRPTAFPLDGNERRGEKTCRNIPITLVEIYISSPLHFNGNRQRRFEELYQIKQYAEYRVQARRRGKGSQVMSVLLYPIPLVSTLLV